MTIYIPITNFKVSNGEIMLEINPAIVCNIMTKARAFHAKEDVVFPEMPLNPEGNVAFEILNDFQNDLTYLELKDIINELEPDQKATVVALLWLGRGDYDIDDWDMALKEATRVLNRQTAEYIIATPMVADYLSEGLALHGYSCEED